MNKKGFTLVELLATLVILGIVVGITIVGVNGGFRNAKEKTEDVFVKTLTDALDIYLDSDAKKLNYTIFSGCEVTKKLGTAKMYKATGNITFANIINSEYAPLIESDLVNPANKGVSCKRSDNIPVEIYRDSDYVYYYKVAKSSFTCLLDTEGYISNLPDGCI